MSITPPPRLLTDCISPSEQKAFHCPHLFFYFVNSHRAPTLCPHDLGVSALAMTLAWWSPLVTVKPSFILCKSVLIIPNFQDYHGNKKDL